MAMTLTLRPSTIINFNSPLQIAAQDSMQESHPFSPAPIRLPSEEGEVIRQDKNWFAQKKKCCSCKCWLVLLFVLGVIAAFRYLLLKQWELEQFIIDSSYKGTGEVAYLREQLLKLIPRQEKNTSTPFEVVDVAYEAEELPIPVQFMRKDQKGKSIAQALYQNETLRDKRNQFHRERLQFVKKFEIPNTQLASTNLALSQEEQQQIVKLNEAEWVRMNASFNFQTVKSQMHMCILSPGINNNAQFRIEYFLNSVLTQNYTNYKVVVIDDGSTDGSRHVYRKYFAFHRVSKKHYIYIQNKYRVTALQNLYQAALTYCGHDSIVLNVDADDELMGRNTLQLFNWGYQTLKAGVLYSNFLFYVQGREFQAGWTKNYTQYEKKNLLYRTTPDGFSHLSSWRNELLYHILPEQLQDDDGNFYRITYDQALFLPLMEMSCGRVYKLGNEINYLYNKDTGQNDGLNWKKQYAVFLEIKQKNKRNCLRSFDRRMSNSQ